MRPMLVYLLLVSVPTLISADFIITESEDHGVGYGRLSPNYRPLKTLLKKRSTNGLQYKDREKIQVYSLKINSKITSRFAHNVITSRVVNRATKSKEALFEVELPKTAFITNFTMTIDDVKYFGEVKEKEAAHQQYKAAVSQGQTAGLVKVSGRKMEKFKVSVNVAPAKKVNFELTYEELLKRKLGKYEMILKVKPMQLVNHFQIDAHIFEPKGIAFLNVHGTFLTNDLEQAMVKNRTETKAHISFKPTLEQQRKCPDCSETLLDGDLIIQYDVNRDLSGGDVQIVNGYFVHHFAPANLPRVPKNVIFVIDRSFSMRGLKFRQTKLALLRILGDMSTQDYFTIISFDSTIEKWRDSLVQATPENVLQAKRYIIYLQLGAETNINDSLLLAVSLLDTALKQKQLPDRSVSMIILLTDGDPNVGEKDPVKIQINVKNAIQERYSLYCLGFGFDVDYSFLEKMALDNGGVARRIYDDSDSALQLQGFYNEVANPLLLDVEMQYQENAISDLTEATFRQFYDGSEIVVAGKISDNSLDVFMVEITAKSASSNLSLEEEVNVTEAESILQYQQYIFGDFTERLWAYLTIQQLLNQRISADAGEKKKLTDRALELSLKYSFVTPLTSMVVTKPEEDKMDVIAMADKPIQNAKLQKQLNGGYSTRMQGLLPVQRGPSLHDFPASRHHSKTQGHFPTLNFASSADHVVTSVDGDPHFIIQLPKQQNAICFNINGKPGSILNLVTDLQTGIKVNGQLIGDKKVENNQKINTYFGTFGIENRKIHMKMAVTTEKINIYYNEEKIIIPWSTTATLTYESCSVTIWKEKDLTIMMGDGATFIIVLHRVWKNHPLHRDFLGFYTLDSHRLSNMTHGLLGQFYHDVDYKVYNIHPGLDPEKPDATMAIKGHNLTVTRGWQKDYRLDSKWGANIPCWFVHNSGKGFIDGTHTDYVVSSLFD
ncbi:inter-alpha-trypsin inhibitor heavy chain H3-like isoform X2 [Stegostoma tigrinum]|uniref:inter-alpha-trypsin inhibitor heavy chain H3-like isoform X2 n=1 Tax=Stegostoma tigrinum TaxID=3053191 RepID=UPI00202AE35F|nr:inter-alpha-trypsin inhibitor heavy chain H3-like isoform X2 [Stegostoma tigrinum]